MHRNLRQLSQPECREKEALPKLLFQKTRSNKGIKSLCRKKAVADGFLVEGGKVFIDVAEIRSAGLSKQFLLVVSNKYNGKRWTKSKAHGSTINLFVQSTVLLKLKLHKVLLKMNSRHITTAVSNSVKSASK